MAYKHKGKGTEVEYIKRTVSGSYVKSTMPVDVAEEILRNSEVVVEPMLTHSLTVGDGDMGFLVSDFKES